jgi:hypothetical protein
MPPQFPISGRLRTSELEEEFARSFPLPPLASATGGRSASAGRSISALSTEQLVAAAAAAGVPAAALHNSILGGPSVGPLPPSSSSAGVVAAAAGAHSPSTSFFQEDDADANEDTTLTGPSGARTLVDYPHFLG